MGRPLAKRYFGNRNVGTTATTDDGIGGEGVASAAVSGGTYTTRPVFTFTAPQIVGGVRATATINSQINAATAYSGTGSGWVTGDTITVGNGTLLTVTATLGLIVGISAYTDRGSFTTLPGAPIAVVAVTSTAGTGGTITFNFSALSTTITEGGSGYTAAPTAATGPTQSVALGTVVLTTDSGAVGSSTNQENAIVAYAYVTANSLLADIQAQKGSHRYLVATSEGSAVCKLVAATPAAVGEMTITATDSAACTYYVTKLTAHRAVLVPFGGGSYVFPTVGTNADGSAIYQSVKWSFTTTDAWYDAATTVTIANA